MSEQETDIARELAIFKTALDGADGNCKLCVSFEKRIPRFILCQRELMAAECVEEDFSSTGRLGRNQGSARKVLRELSNQMKRVICAGINS